MCSAHYGKGLEVKRTHALIQVDVVIEDIVYSVASLVNGIYVRIHRHLSQIRLKIASVDNLHINVKRIFVVESKPSLEILLALQCNSKVSLPMRVRHFKYRSLAAHIFHRHLLREWILSVIEHLYWIDIIRSADKRASVNHYTARYTVFNLHVDEFLLQKRTVDSAVIDYLPVLLYTVRDQNQLLLQTV